MELNSETLRLRTLTLDDVDGWMAGEDGEKIRWFEFPGPALASLDTPDMLRGPRGSSRFPGV